MLSDLHSIMYIPPPDTDRSLASSVEDEQPSVIRIFHASLGDFLLDKSRSAKFYIDAGTAHANLTRYFLKHLSKMDPSTSQGRIFNK